MKNLRKFLGLALLYRPCKLAFANEEPNKSSHFSFSFAAKNIPHIEKRDKGGEDAWVAQSDLLIVADGVGGWADIGVDSGLFSK